MKEMKEIGIHVGNFDVGQIERITGITTDCVYAVVQKDDRETNISYDYISGRFVIHEWYFFNEDEIKEMQTSVKNHLDTYK